MKITEQMTIGEKLRILTDAAKYDVACTSSGNGRRGDGKGMGNCVEAGICHSFSADGRCISLLKILLTNECVFDCHYCVNRCSNDVPRAAFTPDEVCQLTMEFYRRNYVEGLFLSSGVVRNPDYTMERLVRVAKDLRLQYRYNGYIHLKSIPGASQELIREAGLYADRLSVNVEIPNEPPASGTGKRFSKRFYPYALYPAGSFRKPGRPEEIPAYTPFRPCRTKYPNDYRSQSRSGQRHPAIVFRPL